MKLSTAALALCSLVPSITSALVPFADHASSKGQHPITDTLIAKPGRTQDLIALHRNLTEIPSVTGSELEVGQWLSTSLESQGYNTELQKVSKDRYNVLAWPGSRRNPHLLLTSHIDTVPPFLPYNLTSNSSSTIISGRGSVDAKASVAAMIVATNALLDSVEITPNDLALLFVVGEETSGDGMRRANDLGLTPKVVVFGEPTEGKLASGHKGIVLANVKAYGVAAHSGYPWLGRSANAVLTRALGGLLDLEEKLPSSEKFGTTTINVGKMTGGVAANVVAESAEAQVAIRVAEGTPKEIEKLITDAVEAATGEFKGEKGEKVVEVEFWGSGYGPVELDTDVPGFESMVVNYGTDVRNLDETVKGQKRYLYGPGSILVAHSAHEALDLKDLERAVEDYKKLILHSLQV